MEEHLEGEDSAVKDLEDVEVKDLVDLNLNLDPEDGTKAMIQILPVTYTLVPVPAGCSASLLLEHLFVTTGSGKEDLDLGPNDLHLDDFLLSGKFDLIAYADPELNLEEKKDMFNEELDLGEVAAEEKEGGAKKAAHLVKQEVPESPAAAQRGGVCQSAASVVLSKVRSFQSNHHSANPAISFTSALPPLKVEESASGSALHPQLNAAPLGMSSQLHPPSAGGKLSTL